MILVLVGRVQELLPGSQVSLLWYKHNFMRDIWKGIAPSLLRSLFAGSNEIDRNNTRHASKGNYYQKEAKLEIFKRSFSRTGAKVWNLIPSDWRDASKSSFKKKLVDFSLILLDNNDYVEVENLVQ